MRLSRLDLTRYGKFTDRRIDFGAPAQGRPDLHIVYGPNEAGKSTALAAFLDLLFGIGAQSRYNFLHPYGTMQVGGRLDLPEGPRDLVRVKRKGTTLLDLKGEAIGETLIAGELGGIDRASYRTMFSLDDETLEAGGHSILASKGDLGQLLFSASAGLAELSNTLVELRLEADGFHKAKKHGTVLSELKAALGQLKDSKEKIDTFASAYSKLVQERDKAGDQYEAALKTRGATRIRMDEILRQLGALPRLAELRGLREQLLPLADLPEAPAFWTGELPDVERRAIEGTTELKVIDNAIATLSGELQDILVDAAALQAAAGVDRLADPRARYTTAEKDLPERRLAARTAALQIEAILDRLDRPAGTEAGGLMLGAAVTGTLRGLIESRSGIAARVDTAREERDDAVRRLAEARDGLREAGTEAAAAPDLSRLAAAMGRLRGSDHAARRSLADRALPGLRDTLAERMRDLKPWPGDIAQLVDLVVPDPGAFEALVKRRAEAQQRVDRDVDAVERLSTERLRLRAEVGALGESTGVVGDREAGALRAARDRAWSEHRGRLDAASAEIFEDLMRRDDIAAGARFGRATEVARLQQINLALATSEVELQRAEERHAAASLRLEGAGQEIHSVLGRMVPPLPDDGAATPLGPWLSRRRDALAAHAAVRQAEHQIAAAEADGRAARDRIVEALDEAGVSHDPAAPYDRLVATAQAAIDRETASKSLRDQVEARLRDCTGRDTALGKAAAADAAWTAAWAETCGGCWLGQHGTVPSVDAVREVLNLLGELAPLLGKRADMEHRIAAMDQDRASFARDLAVLGNAMGIAVADRPLPDIDDEILRRVGRARQDEAARATAQRKLAEAQARRTAVAEAVAANHRRSVAMTGFFGVETLSEVGTKLRDAARRRDLRERLATAERDITAALRISDAAAAEAALDGLDRAALEAELAELEPRFDAEDARMRDVHSRHVQATDVVEAVGGDDAVARIEEQRRTILLEIEDQARRYLRLRSGIAAAEQALRSYRDRHRSAMMTRASDAFRVISRGAYTGLATQPDKETEILMGVSADGSTKIASDLSKGTRFQLYLALRIAGYYEFARARRVVPFVADDIMETFDDFRAEEAFRLFAGMAEVGQVIYLTHHRHLCDIARSVCPSVTIHDLSAPALQRAS